MQLLERNDFMQRDRANKKKKERLKVNIVYFMFHFYYLQSNFR